MTLNDTLAMALSNISNAEKVGKLTCIINPNSKLISAILTILKEYNYIAEFKVEKTSKRGIIEVTLANKINKCAVIKPRYAVQLDNYEKYEKRYLPAKNIGIIIVSTNKGIITHHEAKEKKLGGRLLAYCY